jgi:outer membrane receptor protein involved in Fe transport
MKLKIHLCFFVSMFLCANTVQAFAAADSDGSDTSLHIVVQKLDTARNGMSPDTGSSTYSIDQQTVDNLPQGQFSGVNDVLLQAPGVAQDSYGQLHVRGDHADLQYRINGIILPEGITGFGQTLDTHFADKITFMTGALPAQYGYRTAGIVNITTKSGEAAPGGTSSVMAGGDQTFEGNQEFYGAKGPYSYYFTGTYDQNDRGIEPPTPGANAIHDFTQQNKEFGYASYVLSSESRVSFILGNAASHFQIPNNPGQAQALTETGVPAFDSAALNEQQVEHNTYAILALQGVIGDKTDYQFAVFSRDSTVLFQPDPLGDLFFTGISSRVDNESFTNGLQNDYTYHLNGLHTIRTGWTASYESTTSDTDSTVFPNAQCIGTNCTAPTENIPDNHSKDATLLGYYLQDEWRALDKLTVNYGARLDFYNAYVSASQLSPRIGGIYDVTPTTKLHAGYARYFTPPPTELVAPETVALFQNTTGAAASTGASPVVPERDNYYDIGVIQKAGSHLTLGADAYYKQAHDLLDEGQFGSALIFAPFNYDKGYVKGLELTGDYHDGPLTGYANLALSRAMGEGIVSGQYNFDPAELSYIASNYVHLDHDQTFTGSAGAAYMFHDIKYSSDLIYGSGLRSGFANTGHLPFYTQVNAGAEHSFDLGKAGSLSAKFSVINLFDKSYEIRDGSGIGVFAPQYGPRRTFFVTLGKSF